MAALGKHAPDIQTQFTSVVNLDGKCEVLVIACPLKELFLLDKPGWRAVVQRDVVHLKQLQFSG